MSPQKQQPMPMLDVFRKFVHRYIFAWLASHLAMPLHTELQMRELRDFVVALLALHSHDFELHSFRTAASTQAK